MPTGNVGYALLFALLLCACDSRSASGAERLDETRAGSPAPGLPDQVAHILSVERGDLPEILSRGRLRVLVPYARPYYFFDEGRPRGIIQDIFVEYAGFLEKQGGLRAGEFDVLFVPCELDQVIPRLLAGHGDVAAAALTITPERSRQVRFSKPLMKDVREILVAHGQAKLPAALDDLAGREVWVAAGSSFAEHMQALAADFRERGLEPPHVRVAAATLSTEDLLEMVHAGILELTVCDAFEAKLWAEVLTDLRPLEQLEVHTGGQIAWAVRPGDTQLLASLDDFTNQARKGTLLGNILFKRYFGSTRWIVNPLDEPLNARLERYAGWARQLAEEYHFDWLRIAAQAFQESRLDPKAESAAGAQGLMQLLPSTAKDMGCKDPFDPEQNLRAGVRYLDWLRSNFFADPELDEVARMDFILAAYNAGPGNVRKWRKQAPARGLDPNLWRDNVEHLALEAVGLQPVVYVDNIEKYYVAYTLADQLAGRRRALLESK